MKRIRSIIAGYRMVVFALAVASVCFFIAFNWGVPFAVSEDTTSTWAVDTIAPVQPLNEAFHRFSRAGTDPVVYPLFHYMVLAASAVPLVAYELATGGMREPASTFPFGLSHPREFFKRLTLIARLVSLVMALGIVVLTYAMGRELFGERAAWCAALSVALLPPLAYYAKTSNLDVPYLFWTMLALYQYLRMVRVPTSGGFLLLGTFVALAIATKDQAYAFFVLVPLVLAVLPNTRRLTFFSAGLLGFALTFALANNLLFGGLDGFRRHLEFNSELFAHRTLSQDGEYHALAHQLSLAGESGLLLLQMFGPLMLAAAVAGVVLAARRRAWVGLSLLLFAAGYYGLTVVLTGSVFSRWLIGLAVLAALFAGYACATLLAAGGVRRVCGVVLLSAGLITQAALTANLNYTLLRDSRVAMENWIHAHVTPGARIESQVQVRYLPRVSDRVSYEIVGNRYDPVDYALGNTAFDAGSLRQRGPDYILILEDVWLTGDPTRQSDPRIVDYFEKLQAGELGYSTAAAFETPSLVPFRQVTAGVRPRTILLMRDADR